MPLFSVTDIAFAWGVSSRTVTNHVAKLIKDKKFKKLYPGRGYTDEEVKQICTALGFKIPESNYAHRRQ